MHMPVDAKKWQHPTSGVLYTWGAKNVSYTRGDFKMRGFSASSVLKGAKHIAAQMGLPFCQQEHCLFKLAGTYDRSQFAMYFLLPRAAVERGFFPQYVDDVRGLRKELDWPKGAAKEGATRVGTYFETSGLEKGEIRWDLWIVIDEAGRTLPETCPIPLRVTSVKI